MADAPDGGDGFKMGDAHVEIHMDPDKAVKSAKKKIEDAAPELEKSGKKAGEGAGKGLNDGVRKKEPDSVKVGGTFSKALFGGMPAAAAAAGVASGVALAGIPLVFGGIAAAVLSSNESIEDSYGALGEKVLTGLQKDTEPLVGTFNEIADEAGEAFDRIQPDLKAIFADLDDGLLEVTGGFTGFIENTMPGVRKAVASAKPEFVGLNSLMRDTGTGVSDMFGNMSTGATSAGRIMESTGRIVRDFLGFAGSLFAELSNTGSPAVAGLEGTLRAFEQTTLSIAHGALPVLFGAVGGGLTVLTGLLQLLNLISGVLGPASGYVGTFASSLFLLDKITFGQVSGQFSKLKESVKSADGVAGKSKAVFAGLASGGMLAVTGAALGLGLVLTLLGNKQQAAAKAAAEHDARVQSLTEAFKESSGAITANVRAVAAHELAQTKFGDSNQSVLDVARQLGLALPTVTDAYLGNKDALNQLNAVLDQQIAFQERAAEQANKEGDDKALGLAVARKQALEQYRDQLNGLMGEQSQAVQAARDEAAATQNSGDAQADAALSTQKHTQALQELMNAQLAMVDKNLAYRNAVAGTAQAERDEAQSVKDQAKALKDHGKNSEEYRAATIKVGDASRQAESAMLRQVQAAGELATAQHAGESDAQVQAAALKAQNDEIIRLALNSGSKAPPALRQMIAGMDATELAARGATVRIDAMGNEIVTLPNGKTIVISAKDQVTAVSKKARESLNWTKTPIIATLALRVSGDPKRQIQSALVPTARASGGPVSPSQLYKVGEEGEEYFIPDQPGTIVPADQTRKIDEAMARVGVSAGAGGAALAASGQVVINNYYDVDYRTDLDALAAAVSAKVAQRLKNGKL